MSPRAQSSDCGPVPRGEAQHTPCCERLTRVEPGCELRLTGCAGCGEQCCPGCLTDGRCEECRFGGADRGRQRLVLVKPDYVCDPAETSLICERCDKPTREHYWDHAQMQFTCRECVAI